MIPTALSAQMGGAVNPGVHVGGAVNPGATVRGAVERGILPGPDLGTYADDRSVTVQELVAGIDGDRQHANLSSAIRLFVLGVYRDQHRQDRTSTAPRL